MTWPGHLLERALRRPDLDLGIISGSTPVLAFGDPVESWVATLGINPSRAEFLDAAGALLDGSDRRLATLPSLGVERYEDLTPDHAVAIVDDCATYFDRRPYHWFRPLDALLDHALDATFAARTACHLDLVQWATRPLWGELPAEDQDELQRQDVGFLRKQLTSLGHRVVVVNGTSAMRSVERNRLVRWHHVHTLNGPPTAQFSVGEAGDTRFVGWTCNLQSQPGAAQHAEQLADLVAQHATGRRSSGSSGGRSLDASSRATDSHPGQPARGVRHAAGSPPADQLDGGPVPKGLRFASKSEIVSYLATWLERSSHGTIGDVGTYGGSVWVTVDSEAGPIGVNRDTTREAIEALVRAAHTPRSYDWLVVANRKGTINRVLFSEDRTPGWYARLPEPLDRETRLGVARDTETGSGPDVTSRPSRHAVTSPAPDPAVSPPSTTSVEARGSRPVVRPGPAESRRRDAVPSGVRPPSTGRAAIVQFPHPGGEHVPTGSVMGWNAGQHQRKFLVSPGRFVDDGDRVHDADLVFWGEWEAQSRVVTRWLPRPELPTVLHTPYWSPPVGEREWQNTDPWVFGDRFLYSNCKQHTNNTPARRPSALQHLPRGSMILFGSARSSRFVIDTVFVVASVAGTFRPCEDRRGLPVDEAFEACTIQRLGTSYEPHIAASTYSLIQGATIDDPVDGMFSFVPCRVHGDPAMRFARPAIDLPGIVNPASRQSPSGAKELRPLDQVIDAWHRVVDQVRRAGLELGVDFATPPRADQHGAGT